jgi:hypothetical protein
MLHAAQIKRGYKMARNVRTARGDIVDFDTIVIKQALADAPMNIEVARRKNFIDAKESKLRGQRRPATPVVAPASLVEAAVPAAKTVDSFEPDNGPAPVGLPPAEAVPIIPERPTKK